MGFKAVVFQRPKPENREAEEIGSERGRAADGEKSWEKIGVEGV